MASVLTFLSLPLTESKSSFLLCALLEGGCSLTKQCWRESPFPCPSLLTELIPSALVPRCCTEVSPQMWHSLCLWAVSRQREEGLWHSFHPTVCRLGVYIPWHELLLRGILLQWVNLAVVSKLSIKTVNTPRLRPVQTHFLPTELPWLNISE